MGSYELDENGRIIINESMSEELKKKIMEYNSYALSNDSDEEEKLSEEMEDYPDDYIDDYDDDSNEGNDTIVELSAKKEVLDSINDIFS